MRVGTSSLCGHLAIYDEDHPHACGDKGDEFEFKPEFKGSSPRVWGQAPRRQEYLCCHSIIPTRVGTSVLSTEDVAGLQDHPHACGDKNDEQADIVIKQGSAPRVWGQANDTAVLFRASV